jgi:hypothetical protein
MFTAVYEQSFSINHFCGMCQGGKGASLCFRSLLKIMIHNTGQQNLTFFFVPRGKMSNPDSTFNAEFKYVSSFSPSPTVLL